MRYPRLDAVRTTLLAAALVVLSNFASFVLAVDDIDGDAIGCWATGNGQGA